MRVLCVLAALCVPFVQGRADGGAVLAQEKHQGLEVTVFASPSPLRVGLADVSVLVRDSTGQAVLDGTVEVGWTSDAPPTWLPLCSGMDAMLGKRPALRSHSRNKLFYGTLLPIRAEGKSEISVAVSTPDGQAQLTIPVVAGPPSAPASAFWPLLALPPVAVGIFALHQRLTRRRD